MMMFRHIAKALQNFLASHLHTGETTRRFFRLDGFDTSTYKDFLELLHEHGDSLAGQPLWIRTTAPILGLEHYALETDKSATWYRNHVPPGTALVLIFNHRTSDAQSLKDIYPVTENLLTTEGLDHLIAATVSDYQLSCDQLSILKDFLTRFRQCLFQPQLRDLAAFLDAFNAYLGQDPGASVATAIAESLPHLDLFRCCELAPILNTPKSDRLLRENFAASRLGRELLDEKKLRTYLNRLETAELDDDRPYGPSPQEKHALLQSFLTEVQTDRAVLLSIFRLDWREVATILHQQTRQTGPKQLQELAAAIKATLTEQAAELSEMSQAALQKLAEGSNPETAELEDLLNACREQLPDALHNKLRRLRGAKKHENSDFIAGVTQLAVEMLFPFQGEIPAGTTLTVTFEAKRIKTDNATAQEALASFCTLYGGVTRIIPSVRWELESLWALNSKYADQTTDSPSEETEGQKTLGKVNLVFSLLVRDSRGSELDRAELHWYYRPDGGAAATLAHVQAEAARLSLLPASQTTARQSCIPIYNVCPEADDIGDLDLGRPIASLGAWYHDVTDLGALLKEDLAPRARPDAWRAVETALQTLEVCWAHFVAQTAQNGVLAADLDAVLSAYQGLLQMAAQQLQQGQEVLRGFRVLTQAWMVGQATFDEWAVVPFLHPLKLHWWRERARQFDIFIGRLLDSADPASIVDPRRFRQGLGVTYSSSGYPAVLALPDRQQRAHYFLPVHELEGYELFRRVEQANLAFGLDPDLVSDDESSRAAQTTARELSRIVQNYIETYPFVRDGLEIYLVQCRNGTLPGLLVEHLTQMARHRKWALRLTVIVHTTDRGASLYQRVTEWLKLHEALAERSAMDYFPDITFKVLECDYDNLFQQVEDADLVILPDVLAEKGQTIAWKQQDRPTTVVPLEGYLPIYSVQQAPFERGEFTRDILLTSQQLPILLQQFYQLQWAAREREAISPDQSVEFRLQVSLQDWEHLITALHAHFNWVACYDIAVDRFLLEDTFPDAIDVIRYSQGLGSKHRHNLTVSSSRRAQDIVVRRLASNLQAFLPNVPHDFRCQMAQHLAQEANHISGDIVLRAAGPGTYLNELLGLVIAKYLTERRYLAEYPDALTAWIYLDDYVHWFDQRMPDLLFVAISSGHERELNLYIELLETKCVGQNGFAHEAADAQKQVAQGVNRLMRAWTPGDTHLDAPYWRQQLYQAVAGNLAVQRDHMPLWETFRQGLLKGQFSIEMSGHTWVFCHDGAVGMSDQADEGLATIVAPEARDVPHHYHHYGRAGVRRVLRGLVEETWRLDTSADTWFGASDEEPPEAVAVKTESESPAWSGERTLGVAEGESLALPDEEVLAAIAAQEPVFMDLNTQGAKDDAAQGIGPSILPATMSSQVFANAPTANWIKQRAQELFTALRVHDIQVYPIEMEHTDIGSSIIRFKVKLRPGERVQRLQNRAADLQREMALKTIPLIDNVSGTHYVGIDLPHPEPAPVSLHTALSELRPTSVGRLPFLVGQTPDGRIIKKDLSDGLYHMLIAGSTGSGKTIFLYTFIMSLALQFGPEALELLLVDPKQTDFVYFENLPHLMSGQVIIEPEEAIDWLDELMEEHLPERTQQLRHSKTRDIAAYNTQHPDAPMKPIVVVIDEYADLVQVLDGPDRKRFEQQLSRLAQRARNVGIHLVIATQRPTADIVTSKLKVNLPVRIAFRLPSHHDSATILDHTGAENLLGKGDMLFRTDAGLERLQGFYLNPEQLKELLSRHRLPPALTSELRVK